MNETANSPKRLVSDIYNSLSGLAWNLVLLLFAVVWLVGDGYTLYSLFTNIPEISLLWLMCGLFLLAGWGLIAGFGAMISIMGVYNHTKALLTGT